MSDDRACVVCGRDIGHRGDSTIYCHTTCRRKAARDRRKERPAPLPPLLPPTHCVRCDKVACPTEEAAKDAKRAVEVKTGRRDEVRYYECPEGWWHWTRMDASLDGFRSRNGGVA